MKQSLLLFLLLYFCFSPISLAESSVKFTVGNGKYNINGQIKEDVAPYISNGRVMLPLRYIAHAINIPDNAIQWEPISRSVFLTKSNQILSIKIGSSVASIGNRAVMIDSPAEIKYGRTMLPLRTITEVFGIQAEWDPITKTVTLGPQSPSSVERFYALTQILETSGIKIKGIDNGVILLEDNVIVGITHTESNKDKLYLVNYDGTLIPYQLAYQWHEKDGEIYIHNADVIKLYNIRYINFAM